MPKTIEVRAESKASAESLFRLLTHAETWPEWSPIGSARVERPGPDGVLGEIRRFETGRVVSVEEVVEVVPPRRFSYVLRSGLPLLDYRAEVEIVPGPDARTVVWRSRFRPRYPGTGWLYRLMLRRFLQRVVDGLASAAESNGREDPGVGRDS